VLPALRSRRQLICADPATTPAGERQQPAVQSWAGVLASVVDLLAALRESDFSIRAPRASGDDPLGAVMLESTCSRPRSTTSGSARWRPARCCGR